MISIAALTNLNNVVPWGLWVSIYIFLVGISAGIFALVAWGNLRENLHLQKITRMGLALALSTLLAGLLSIQVDLGRIERFANLFTSPNFGSVMGLMVWLYGIYSVFLVISLILYIRGQKTSLFKSEDDNDRSVFRSRKPRALARGASLKKGISKQFFKVSLIFALAVIVIESLLFARPAGKHWHSLIFPIHFLVSSLASAIAALIFMAGIFWPRDKKEELLKGLSKIALPIIAINLGVEIIGIISLGSISHPESWLLLLGNIIAITLLLKHNSLAITFAGGIELIAILLTKYNSLISAQTVEPFKGFARSYIEPRLRFSYIPNALEFFVAAFLVGLAIGLFYFLYKVLPKEG